MTSLLDAADGKRHRGRITRQAAHSQPQGHPRSVQACQRWPLEMHAVTAPRARLAVTPVQRMWWLASLGSGLATGKWLYLIRWRGHRGLLPPLTTAWTTRWRTSRPSLQLEIHLFLSAVALRKAMWPTVHKRCGDMTGRSLLLTMLLASTRRPSPCLCMAMATMQTMVWAVAAAFLRWIAAAIMLAQPWMAARPPTPRPTEPRLAALQPWTQMIQLGAV